MTYVIAGVELTSAELLPARTCSRWITPPAVP